MLCYRKHAWVRQFAAISCLVITLPFTFSTTSQMYEDPQPVPPSLDQSPPPSSPTTPPISQPCQVGSNAVAAPVAPAAEAAPLSPSGFVMIFPGSTYYVPSTATAPPSPAPPAPDVPILDESGFFQAISAANFRVSSSGIAPTTLLLPPVLTLTAALPVVTGNIQLLAANGRLAVISCSSSYFTALTITASTFSMEGLTWVNCGTVLRLNPLGNDASEITIDTCTFHGNLLDLTAVSHMIGIKV